MFHLSRFASFYFYSVHSIFFLVHETQGFLKFVMGKEIPDWIISCFWNHLDEEIYTVHETYTLLKWTMKTKNRVMRIKCPFLMPTTSQKLIEMSFSQNFWYWWWIFDKTGVFNLVYHLTAWGNRSLVHFLLWPLQQRFKFRFNFLIVLHFTVQFVIGDFWSRVVLKSSLFSLPIL